MPLKNFAFLFYVFSLTVSATPAAFAGTWVLSNGDRLTGLLVSENEQEVVIEHAVLGRVTLARTALKGEIADKAAEPTTAAVPTETKPAPVAATPAAAAPATPVPVNETPASRSAPRLKWMNRQIELGYAQQDGARHKEDLTVRLQGEARFGANSLRGTAQLTRSEAENQVVVDRSEANFRWRHDFDKRLFAQSLTTYASDGLRKIDLSLEQQVGGGYRLLDERRQQINVGVGAVLQRLAREGAEDHTALLGSAFQDYALQWNERLRFTQEATVWVSDSGSISRLGGTSTIGGPSDGSYRVKFNAALQTKMTDKVSLLLRYEYDYDASLPEEQLRTDARLTTSLGYSW